MMVTPLALGLSDEHAVEGVGVVVRQVLHSLSVRVAERKFKQAPGSDFCSEVIRCIQFSQFLFYRDFHSRHRTDINPKPAFEKSRFAREGRRTVVV